MALSIQHGSRVKRIEAGKTDTSITWQGTYSEVKQLQESLVVGDYYDGLGGLTKAELTQGEGVIWQLALDYTITLADLNTGNEEDGQPTEQELSAQLLSVPIEVHPNYRTNWNHFLVAACYYEGDNYTNRVPSWYNSAKDPYLDPMTTDGKNYRWVKQLSEAPPATKYIQWGIVKSGNTICRPVKPGVTSYDKSTFVIKEIGYHSKKSMAGWATRDMLNTIVDKPLLGDFSITRPGYNWKVDDIQVTFAGGKWQASRTYTMSGDNNGWDRAIYP